MNLRTQGRIDCGQVSVKAHPVVLMAQEKVFSQNRIISNVYYGPAFYRIDFRTFRRGKIQPPVHAGSSCYGVDPWAVET
jgi:hypothetical protein